MRHVERIPHRNHRWQVNVEQKLDNQEGRAQAVRGTLPDAGRGELETQTELRTRDGLLGIHFTLLGLLRLER